MQRRILSRLRRSSHGFGELFVVQGHAGQVIQVVDHGANALSGVCVSMQRMSKRTVTQMKLRNRIEGVCSPFPLAFIKQFGAKALIWSDFPVDRTQHQNTVVNMQA